MKRRTIPQDIFTAHPPTIRYDSVILRTESKLIMPKKKTIKKETEGYLNVFNATVIALISASVTLAR